MSDEIFLSNFKKSFHDLKSKNIVLYGLSYGTKLILEHFADYNIIGLMDGYKVKGEMYGKDILSYDDAIHSNTEIIIIVARPVIVELIRKRISRFCKRYGIDVYTAEGVKLELEQADIDTNHPYFQVSKEVLMKSINEHEIISFDIFDTLVMRKVLYPSDVFEIMEKRLESENRFAGFADKRRNAEITLLKHGIPSFDAIYDELQKTMELTDSEKEKIKSLEITIEKKILIPREEMVSVMRHAISLGKKVYLTSDMYHSKKWLQQQLKELGITDYEELIVSCEYNTCKAQELFEELRKKVGNKSLLHIGDSVAFDIEAAERKNIDCFRIYSASDMMEISTYKELLYHTNTISNRLLIGMFISRIFNSPFHLHNSEGRGSVNKARDIGYLFAAPIITQFMIWFMKQIKDDKIDYILFAARDGYLISQLYEVAVSENVMKEMPKAVYLLTSRAICLLATIFNSEDIKYTLAVPFEGSPEDLLLKRFMLDKKDVLSYDKKLYSNKEEYIFAHEDKILNKSREIREKYLKYLLSTDVDKMDKVAFFDFVSSGTCHLLLSRLLEREFEGYYFHRFGTMDTKKQELSVKSLYKKEGTLAANSLFMESLLTSFKPTLRYIGDGGIPVYFEEKRSLAELDYIAENHEGIKEHFKEYISIFGVSELDENTRLISEDMLGFIFKSYTRINNDIFENYVIDDEIHNLNLHVSNIYRY